MHNYENGPLPEAWAWEEPVFGGTWKTHVRAGWEKPLPSVTKFNLRPLYSAEKPQQPDATGEKLEAIFYQDENGTRWVYSDAACASINGPDSDDKEISMNVEQALDAADESDAEGLRGLYPTAAQVLAAEVRDLRERLERQTKIATDQIGYTIALQRAIEAHAHSEEVPPFVAEDCPHHAEKLNSCFLRHNAELTGVRSASYIT